jgi:hypothetical protein
MLRVEEATSASRYRRNASITTGSRRIDYDGGGGEEDIHHGLGRSSPGLPVGRFAEKLFGMVILQFLVGRNFRGRTTHACNVALCDGRDVSKLNISSTSKYACV